MRVPILPIAHIGSPRHLGDSVDAPLSARGYSSAGDRGLPPVTVPLQVRGLSRTISPASTSDESASATSAGAASPGATFPGAACAGVVSVGAGSGGGENSGGGSRGEVHDGQAVRHVGGLGSGVEYDFRQLGRETLGSGGSGSGGGLGRFGSPVLAGDEEEDSVLMDTMGSGRTGMDITSSPSTVGPGCYCSTHHRLPFNACNRSSKCVA